MDILLDNSGDILITERGDVILANSVAQKIRIKLLWFEGEWRWDDEEGLPYFEDLFTKNPEIALFESQAKDAILDIEEVESVDYLRISYNRYSREAVIEFRVRTTEDIIESEVVINGLRSN